MPWQKAMVLSGESDRTTSVASGVFSSNGLPLPVAPSGGGDDGAPTQPHMHSSADRTETLSPVSSPVDGAMPSWKADQTGGA
jgi:hypothetical protein